MAAILCPYKCGNPVVLMSEYSSGPFHLIPAWICNYIHYKGWDKITYPSPNFNGATVELKEWIGDFTPHLPGHVITYPYLD